MKKRKEKEMKWKKWIGNQIGDEGAQAISESLKINTSLTTLNLGSDKKIRNEKDRRNEKKWIGNEIGYEGAKAISESLKINTTLTELNLRCDEKKMEEKREENEKKR